MALQGPFALSQPRFLHGLRRSKNTGWESLILQRAVDCLFKANPPAFVVSTIRVHSP